MYCQKCGTELPDGSEFCNKCGTKIINKPISNNDDNAQSVIQKRNFKWTKKKIIIAIIGFCIILGVILFFVIPRPEKDFRQTTWGMTKAQVKQSETIDITDVDDNNMTASNVNFGNFSVSIDYQFNNGKLASAGYIYQDSNFESEEFTDAKSTYNSFINILEKQYGKPKTISNDENPSYKNCNTDKTIWETRDTTITVVLSDLMGSNNLSVLYEPKKK